MYQDDFDLYDKAIAAGDHEEVIAILDRRARKEPGVNGAHVGAMVCSELTYYCGFNTEECHAEIMAFESASWDAVIDIELWGELYVNKAPCLHCAARIIWERVSVVHCPALRKDSKWYQSQLSAISLMESVGISVKQYSIEGVRG